MMVWIGDQQWLSAKEISSKIQHFCARIVEHQRPGPLYTRHNLKNFTVCRNRNQSETSIISDVSIDSPVEVWNNNLDNTEVSDSSSVSLMSVLCFWIISCLLKMSPFHIRKLSVSSLINGCLQILSPCINQSLMSFAFQVNQSEISNVFCWPMRREYLPGATALSSNTPDEVMKIFWCWTRGSDQVLFLISAPGTWLYHWHNHNHCHHWYKRRYHTFWKIISCLNAVYFIHLKRF